MGAARKVTLVQAGKVPIVRHIKIKASANPYDPQWEHYFELRLDAKMGLDLRVTPAPLSLWRSQNGVCPVCQQTITHSTGWENHHIIWRVYGGSDQLENRVLLHPTCHKQVHSLRLTVLKLRPTTGR